MFIYRSMTSTVFSLLEESNIADARELMREKNIRHVPIVDKENHLVGIVTDRDIRSALPSTLYMDDDEQQKYLYFKLHEIMTPKKELISIHPNQTIQDVLLIFKTKNVGAIPVTDKDNKLVGMLSVRDMVRDFIKAMSIGEPGTLIGILMEEKLGQHKRIVDAITDLKIGIGSILTIKDWEDGKRAVFPYLLTSNVPRVKNKLKELGFELIDPKKWVF